MQPSCRSLASKQLALPCVDPDWSAEKDLIPPWASKPPRREKGTQRNTNKHGHIPKRPQCKRRKVFCGDPMHTEGVYRRQTLQGKDAQVMGGQC